MRDMATITQTLPETIEERRPLCSVNQRKRRHDQWPGRQTFWPSLGAFLSLDNL